MAEKRSLPNVAPAGNGDNYDSRTQAHTNSTAARIDKQYRREFPISSNPDKRAARGDDGYVTSHAHAVSSRFLRRRAAGNGKTVVRGSDKKHTIDLDYHHPLEDVLATRWMRRLLG